MNADRLLAEFDRLAEVPDAVPRLRRFVLDLAVRGKLVEQDHQRTPRSVPGSHALPSEALDASDVWSVPATWTFRPLASLAGKSGVFIDGDWVETKDQDPDGGVRLIQLADVGLGTYRNRSSRFMNAVTAARLNCTHLRVGDLLIARMPDPLGRACIFPGDAKPSVTVVDVAILRLGVDDIDAEFAVLALNAPPFARNVEAKAAGTTRSRISRGNLVS